MQIEVLTELKAKSIDKTFTYKVPNELEEIVKVGSRVIVPFNNQKLEGFVMGINTNKVDYEIKDIFGVIDSNPVINEEMMDLGKYMSKKTLSNLISCYQTMLPSALKAKKGINVNKKRVSYLEMIDVNYIPKNNSQAVILGLLKNGKVLKEEANKISSSSVKTLVDKKIINEIKEEVYRLNDDTLKEKCHIVLNKEQQLCFDIVKSSLNMFKTFLLYGVTGSGKTEVYMHIIEEVLKNKKEVIVLVPEISLTPQLVNTFKKRFGNKVAILHSGLSDGEKYDEWRKIERKEVSIVIGARSAIFAPFTNLGLIIIDEEHTSTYKQDNNPRYNAKDIALYRAKKYNIPVLLGSATPSIESYTNTLIGNYELLTIKNRVNDNFPDIELVNMVNEMKKGNRIISSKLYDKINECLIKKEQIIILLNKRGYSRVITCHNCGYTDKCPKCDIPLTYHKKDNKMKCHYCNYEHIKISKCPICSSENINEFGLGTEKLESELKLMFPQATLVRMDADTTTKKGQLEQILEDFKNEKYDILIGTQMISKGLDFKKVTLVGVINGDSSLNIPDFRSAERTFQLINQVSGRAGRDKLKGNVIIQGFNTEHYSIKDAANNDYISFYNEEIAIRKKLKYPPFYNLSLIKVAGNDYEKVYMESDKIASYLRKNNSIITLGPSLAMIPKINNQYYIQIIVKYKKIKDVVENLEYIKNHYLANNKISVQIDINPIKL